MEKRYKRNPLVFWRKIEDQVVLIYNDLIYNLKNESAVYIWELIDGKNTLSKIKDKIAEDFSISLKQAEEDLLRFTNKLKDIGLIE